MAIGNKPFDKLSEEDKLAILERVREFHEIAETGNADLMQRMREQEDFAIGIQWDDAFVAQMEERGKLCLTIPMIQPQIKQMLGHIVQNPREIAMYNMRGGLKVLADLQTALIEHAMQDQNARHQQIQWAEQGITTGCSYLGLFRNSDSDPKGGDLEIARLNEFEVLTDPSCKVYDINAPRLGARFVIWQPWEDRSYVEAQWPEAMEHFGTGGGTHSTNGMIHWFLSGLSAAASHVWNWVRESDVFSLDKLRVPVLHCWWTEYIEVQYFYDLRGDELGGIILSDPSDIKKARKAVAMRPDTFELRKAVTPIMYHSICLGTEVLLDHRVDEFNLLQTGLTLYPVVPFHANFNNGYKAGVTEAMIGPQRWFNWMRSMVVNIMKNQPNSGYMVNGGTRGDLSWLEDHGGEDGIVIDRSKFGGGVDRIDPANLPPMEMLAEVGKEEIREVVNMHVDAPQDEPKNMSGLAMQLRQQKGITGISPVLSNFDYSLTLWGQLVAAVIRANPVYNDAEIREIIEEKDLLDPQLMKECQQAVATAMGLVLPQPPKPLDPLLVSQLEPVQASKIKAQFERHMANYQAAMSAINSKAKPMAITALIDAMHNARRGRYQCRVTLSTESVTQRMRNLVNVAETNQMLLANQQPPLSDRYIIENSDLPDKEAVLAERGYAQ